MSFLGPWETQDRNLSGPREVGRFSGIPAGVSADSRAAWQLRSLMYFDRVEHVSMILASLNESRTIREPMVGQRLRAVGPPV